MPLIGVWQAPHRSCRYALPEAAGQLGPSGRSGASTSEWTRMVGNMSTDDAIPSVAIDDLLFAGRIIEAMTAFRDWSGCGLQGAIDGIGERIAILKVSSPERFTVPLEGYGSGVFT